MSRLNRKKCLDSALRLLGHRDHSCSELRRKLRQRGFEAEQIDTAIDKCRRLNYLDDGKFSDIYAEQLRRKGYGPVRIAQMLKGKGVADDHIGNALSRHCDNGQQIEDCRSALAKKIRSTGHGEVDAALKARLFRFLSGRGFLPDIIRQVLHEGLD